VPSRAELEGLHDKIIARLIKVLTRLGYLVEEGGVSYIADIDPDNPLASLQAASCPYRIALIEGTSYFLSKARRTFTSRNSRTAALALREVECSGSVLECPGFSTAIPGLREPGSG
jgi:hypothetical protein